MSIFPTQIRTSVLTSAAIAVIVYSISTGFSHGEPFRHSASGFECPDEIAGFARISVQDFEAQKPGLGISCKYQLRNDSSADVYVFNGGRNDIPKDVTHPLMTQLRAQTLKEIEQVATSRGELFRRTGGGTIQVETDQGPVAVLLDALIISAPGNMPNSFLFLWTARNHAMKIRVSIRPSPAHDPKAFKAFYEGVVRLAASSPR